MKAGFRMQNNRPAMNAARWLALLALVLLAAPAWAQQGGGANDLVRRVISNEDRASKTGVRYRYKIRNEKPRGTVVKELIETDEGLVARLVSVNGQPPTAEQRKADEQKLDRLASDAEFRREKRREQQKDEQRTRAMVKALPDAFLYEHDGDEVVNGIASKRLKFRPNPQFDPPIRETLVYKGMEGYMWVEPKEERLVKIQARLFEDVTIGWGILGRLNKGGRFEVEQSKIEGKRWELTRMELDFTGRALLFKTIKIKSTDTAYDFRAVPAGLTLAQGIELLRKPDQPTVAERSANGAKPSGR